MTPAFCAIAIVLAVLAELVFPGHDIYHYGWYNVGLAALLLLAIFAGRKQIAARRDIGTRARVAVTIFGAFVVGVAGIANGLLAPDNRTIVAAPGQRVQVDDLGGTLDFPLAATGELPEIDVGFDRGGSITLLSPSNRNVGTFVLRTADRTVVYVEARNARGDHLTVTQPTGVAFLSPVLLMQQTQTIAGLDLPFDSFAVPAAHRIVKAVLLTPQQAAAMRGMSGLAVPAVLFAVDDENDRPLRNAIVLCPDGSSVSVDALELRAEIFEYPAVEAMATPSLGAVVSGTLLALAGAIAQGVAGASAARSVGLQ